MHLAETSARIYCHGKILINQKSDWYLDELVAEMEQRTEKVDYSVYLFMLVDDC